MCGCLWVTLAVYSCVSFYLCSPLVDATSGAQTSHVLECLGETQAAPPVRLCNLPHCSDVCTSAHETSTNNQAPHKRKRFWSLAFPHRSWQSSLRAPVERQERLQASGKGFLQPQLQPTPFSKDPASALNPHWPGRNQETGAGVEQRTKGTHGVMNFPSPAKALVDKISESQKVEQFSRASLEQQTDLDGYLSFIMALTGNQPRLQLPEASSVGFQNPSSLCCPLDLDLGRIESKITERYPAEIPEDLHSIRSFVLSALKYNQDLLDNGPPQASEQLSNSRPVETNSFGMNLELKSATRFGGYVQDWYEGEIFPILNDDIQPSYVKLLHEVGIQAGRKRTGILHLVKESNEAWNEILPYVNAWYAASGARRARTPHTWMKFVVRCTYRVINQIILLEYLTTAFGPQEIQVLREDICTFLRQSKRVWAFYFNVTARKGHVQKPKSIHDFANSFNTKNLYNRETLISSDCWMTVPLLTGLDREKKPQGFGADQVRSMQKINDLKSQNGVAWLPHDDL